MIEQWLLMLEAIALCLIGGSAYILLKHLEQDIKDLQPARYLALCVVVGITVFAMLGEPSNATAWQFLAAGFGAPAFVKQVFVPWWKA